MPDRSVVYSFIGKFDSLNAGLTTAGRNAQELGTKLTALDRDGAKMRAGLDQVGRTAGRVGLVAAAGLGAVVLSAAKFDKAMSSVQAATHETTGNMEDLRAAALKAGADTAYSATEAASAIEELAKAGVSTSDILGGGLSGSLNLAAAGAIDVADAAELAATAMTQFKLGGDQVNHVADLLAAGAGKAQGSVDDLGMALKQGGLVASQTGLSIEETVGTLSAFASAGLTGSDAGTSFKTMLQSLTPSSVTAKEEMERLGISAYDAQGNFVGMTEFAGQLRASLSTLSVEQQNAALKTIFGSDAVRAAAVIYDQGADGIQGWIDKTNDAGYAAETAATRMDNLAGDWEQFTGSLETALIGAGNGSQGPLRQLVQGATDVVNAFNKLPQAGQSAATGLLAVTAVLGGGLWFTSKVIGGIANTKEALSDLGIEAGRTKSALSNIGTAAVSLGAVIVTADLLQAAFNKLADTRIDSSNLVRDLEALADDRLTDNLDDLFQTFQDIDDGWQAKANPISWISSWDPSGFESAQKNVEALDQAFASLVESGNAETAAAAFENLGPTAEKAGISTEKLAELFPEYRTALDNAATSTGDVAGATAVMSDEQAAAAKRVAAATAAAEKQAAALKKSRDAARETAKGFITLGDSLDDGKKSLGEWMRDLERQAEALRNFTANARTAAKRGLDDGLIKSLNEAGPAGALRMKQLANATDAEIKRANRAWREGQAAIREYINMQVPPKKPRVDTSQAMDAVAALKYALSQIRDKTVNISLLYKRSAIDVATRADGGEVPGARYPYGDKTLIMAAPGEEVITNRNGEADRFRADRAAGRIPAYANGGTVAGYADGGTTGGITPDSPLFGIDKAFLSIRELAKRLENLSQRQLRDLGSDIDHLGKHGLTKLSKALDLATQAAEENVDAAKEHRSAVLDDIKALRSTIADRFRSDVFGQDLGLGDSGLSASALALHQQGSVTGGLRDDIREAREAQRLYRELRQMGVRGAALTYAQENASIEELRALANDPAYAQQYQRLYGVRQEVSAGTGQVAAMQRFGHELRQSNRELAGMRKELQELKQLDRRNEKHLDAIEKNTKDAPGKTGKAVGDKVNGAQTAGSRGRTP